MNSKLSYVQSKNYRMIFLLAAYRRLAGISSADIAREMGVSRSTITFIEAGNRTASDEMLKAYSRCISEAFEYEPTAYFRALEEVAQRLKLSESQAKNNISFVNCLRKISIAMLKAK